MSRTQNNLSKIFIHSSAIRECRKFSVKPESIASSIADYWARFTSGPRIKALRATPGKDYRCRWGDKRAIFSVDRSSPPVAYIQHYDSRDDIYDRFMPRLRQFWASTPKNEKYIEIDFKAKEDHDLGNLTLDRVLKEKQNNYLQNRLRHNATGSPSVSIGYGPPGSGKTVVAQRLAIDKYLLDYSVELLVPSLHLKNLYENYFNEHGVYTNETEDSRRLVVSTFAEFFATRASKEHAFARQSKLRDWWINKLAAMQSTKIRARIDRPLREITELNFDRKITQFIDALLEDNEWWKSYAPSRRDRISSSVDKYYNFLTPIREELIGSLDETFRTDSQFCYTRAKLAILAQNNIPVIQSTTEDRQRLILVDEAQDLAPSEWKMLLGELNNQHNERELTYQTELILIGDERQRISLVPFSWSEIKRYTTKTIGIPPNNIYEKQIDTASYRMKRNVARVAEIAWNKEICEDGKFRGYDHIDLDQLAEGGSVDVIVQSGKGNSANINYESIVKDWLENEHLFVIYGDKDVDWKENQQIEEYSVASAKGLEEESVLINHPIGLGRSKPRKAITGDDSTQLYTSISRARNHVLMIIDEVTWKEIGRCKEAWSVAEIYESPTKAKIKELVDKCRITLTGEDIVELLLKKLESLASDQTQSDAEIQLQIENTLRRLVEKASEDAITRDLINFGKSLVENNSNSYYLIRDNLDSLKETPNAYIGTLIFLGELATSIEYIQTLDQESVIWSEGYLGDLIKEYPDQKHKLESKDKSKNHMLTEELILSELDEDFVTRIKTLEQRAGS